MTTQLLSQQVGPWSMNTYAILCDETQISAIVDPGDDADTILAMTDGTQVDKILLTHAHADHVGALAEVKAATGAPIYLNPAEKERFGVTFDHALADGDVITIGNAQVNCIHTPGHTPGMICFRLDHRIVVGDTIFVGGPGRTWSPQEFAQTMKTLQEIVFQWPDETEFYPGHGPSGTIGRERTNFETFVTGGWPDDLYGDVTWQSSPSQ